MALLSACLQDHQQVKVYYYVLSKPLNFLFSLQQSFSEEKTSVSEKRKQISRREYGFHWLRTLTFIRYYYNMLNSYCVPNCVAVVKWVSLMLPHVPLLQILILSSEKNRKFVAMNFFPLHSSLKSFPCVSLWHTIIFFLVCHQNQTQFKNVCVLKAQWAQDKIFLNSLNDHVIRYVWSEREFFLLTCHMQICPWYIWKCIHVVVNDLIWKGFYQIRLVAWNCKKKKILSTLQVTPFSIGLCLVRSYQTFFCVCINPSHFVWQGVFTCALLPAAHVLTIKSLITDTLLHAPSQHQLFPFKPLIKQVIWNSLQRKPTSLSVIESLLDYGLLHSGMAKNSPLLFLFTLHIFCDIRIHR